MRPILATFALFGLVAAASADTTIDNPADGDFIGGGTSRGSNLTFSIGQSFTVPAGGDRLTGFTLTAAGAGPTDTGVFRVYAFAGDVLGSVLYESPSFAFDDDAVSRTFVPNVTVAPGSTYLALITSTQGLVAAGRGLTYAGGDAFSRSGNDPVILFQNTNLDLAFRATFTSVQAVPEPFTLSLGTAALAVALKRRRKA